jgi:hypothetical protein
MFRFASCRNFGEIFPSLHLWKLLAILRLVAGFFANFPLVSRWFLAEFPLVSR